MQPIYTNNNLFSEKSEVIKYFTKRAEYKNYPYTYQLAIFSLINEAYDLCTLDFNQDVFNHALVKKALIFAEQCHEGQFRKFINVEYIVHPLEMASRLSNIKDIQPEQLAGALLHDVVEDCEIPQSQIHKNFGELVAYYVNCLTDPAKPQDGNRAIRMNINFQHFILGNNKAKDIKLTDLLSNTRSIIFCDPNFCSVYVPSLEHTFNYLESIQEELNPELFTAVSKTTALSRKVLNLQQNFNIVKLDKKK